MSSKDAGIVLYAYDTARYSREFNACPPGDFWEGFVFVDGDSFLGIKYDGKCFGREYHQLEIDSVKRDDYWVRL